MRTDEAGDPAARRPLVLAAVTGFVVGSGVIGVLWALSGGASGAAEDARAACAALARAGVLPDRLSDLGSMEPGTLRHVAAARELSAAAAEANPVYTDLAEALDGVSRMVISLNFSDPGGRRHLERATDQCAHV